jgi:hypothetical protein
MANKYVLDILSKVSLKSKVKMQRGSLFTSANVIASHRSDRLKDGISGSTTILAWVQQLLKCGSYPGSDDLVACIEQRYRVVVRR